MIGKLTALALASLLTFAACGSPSDDTDTGAEPTVTPAPESQTPAAPEEGGCGAEGELGIEDTKEGSGDEAKKGNVLRVNYTGKLEDGTQFDSSLDPGRAPFEFQLGAGQVIAGWDEGFGGMKEGGLRTLTIPWNMGYGETGAPPTIPPCATLIFDVELVKILQK